MFAIKEGFEQRGPVVLTPSAETPMSVEITLYPSSRPDEAAREFAGVGMTLGGRDGVVTVQDAYEGGPGREAGIRPGDQILAVDGVPVSGDKISDAVGRIRGEVGSTVTLTLRRDGREIVVAVPRAIVKF